MVQLISVDCVGTTCADCPTLHHQLIYYDVMRCFLVLFLAVLGISDAQQVHRGQCGKVQPMRHFVLESFLGTWYEHQKYPIKFELGNRCNTLYFTPRTRLTIDVVTKAIRNLDGNTQNIRANSATLAGNGVLDVVFPANRKANFIIVGTDYKNWAAVFVCKDLPLKVAHADYAWLLTKNRKPSQEHIKAALEAFKAHGVNTNGLKIVSQERCGNLQ